MPAIVHQEDRATWLDPSVDDPEVLLPILRPYESDRMEVFPVSTDVNSPRNDGPGLVKRLDTAW
jgi:putative SOS response-associated peptidase YedK